MDSVVAIRQAEAADAPAIRRLARQAYVKWVPVIGREPKPMAADYHAAVLTHRFELLYVDAVLAALIETIEEGDEVVIENLAVAPDFQRRGLGSLLMGHVETRARTLRYRRLRLYTNGSFSGNVRLYARLGFHIDAETAIDRGHVRVDMSKPLEA